MSHNSILYHPNTLIGCSIPVAFDIYQSSTIVIAISPRRSPVGGDDALAALKGLGDYETEVVGKSWENKNVAPLPHFLLLLSECVADNTQFNAFNSFDGSLKAIQTLKRMLTTEIKQMQRAIFGQGIHFRIWQAEESFNVSHFDRRASFAEIRLDPPLLRLASSDKSLDSAEAKALNGSDKSLLPTMISAADWIVAALRHPMDIPAPKGRPPKAGLP